MVKVSVIIPTYNRATLVLAAIESVRAQTFGEPEILVVDDGSTDDTQALVGSLPEAPRYLRQAHSGLPAVARNTGIAKATGEYLAFLDSDDEWLPDKLERQVELLDSEPDLGLVCSNAVVAGSNGEAYLDNRPGARGRLFGALLEDNFVIASTAIVRRSLLDRTGPFCEDRGLRALEDYDLWLRVAAVSQIHFDPEPLAIYRDVVSDGIRGEQSQSAHLAGLLATVVRAMRFAEANDAASSQEVELARELYRRRRQQLTRLLWRERRYLAAARARLRRA